MPESHHQFLAGALNKISVLNRVIGCVAGVPVYFLAKAACHVANLGRARRRLDADVESLMRGYLPDVEYGRVQCVVGASLPANWLKWLGGSRRITADGMTFGSTIFLRRSFNADVGDAPISSSGGIDRAALSLLLHELVHVDQVRRFGGEMTFACRYGAGFLDGGGYRSNPLETEAYDLVTQCAASLRDRLPG